MYINLKYMHTYLHVSLMHVCTSFILAIVKHFAWGLRDNINVRLFPYHETSHKMIPVIMLANIYLLFSGRQMQFFVLY